ncbi:protein CMSS1 [Ambystoma mexicanum]|uniref:protein CMSS1 n=1 Tax=Ambystoma mexicanum TaxID=8296 RepID=UPI0037E9691D
MADELGDQWWQEEPQQPVEEAAGLMEVDKPNDGVKKKKNGKQVKILKRKKTESGDNTAKSKKKKQPSECFLEKVVEEDTSVKKVKKRRKKKISDILAKSAPMRGVPGDLQKLLVQHFENKRSVIEMEELRLPEECFLPPSDSTHTLSSYLKEICPKWAKLCKNHVQKKSLLILIVCSSAHRVLELIKLLNAFKGDGKVLKLFAKHIKIKEQIKLLEKGVTHLGVGTPGRIKALIEQDGLILQPLKYLVLDWNWRDQKLRRMMDVPEVKKETIELLEGGITASCRAGSMKLGLF